MGTRRRAREIALTALYESEFHEVTPSLFLRRQAEEEKFDELTSTFALDLLHRYFADEKIVNARLEEHSSHWKLSRMAIVDRNILRLGITEILHFLEIPKSVSINEYLEIAKKYGTEGSASFVNGILDCFEKPTA